ncbi:hypothetical protein [Paenibacillus polymyxa]|nr:hypothetical protein [Paenibacillus polymyxa]
MSEALVQKEAHHMNYIASRCLLWQVLAFFDFHKKALPNLIG